METMQGPRLVIRNRGVPSTGSRELDTAKILERCLGGDELAWEALVRQHQGRICSIAYGYVGEQDEARDLAQDIFVRVYQRLHTCTEADKFESWLVRIARNACIDHLRRRKARPPRQDIPADEMTALAGGLTRRPRTQPGRAEHLARFSRADRRRRTSS